MSKGKHGSRSDKEGGIKKQKENAQSHRTTLVSFKLSGLFCLAEGFFIFYFFIEVKPNY